MHTYIETLHTRMRKRQEEHTGLGTCRQIVCVRDGRVRVRVCVCVCVRERERERERRARARVHVCVCVCMDVCVCVNMDVCVWVAYIWIGDGGKKSETRVVVYHYFTCFTSTKIQILTPEELLGLEVRRQRRKSSYTTTSATAKSPAFGAASCTPSP
jgi:hypothetical protein